MPVFEYKAISKDTGKVLRGVIDADNAVQARRKLREMQLVPTDLVESSDDGKVVIKDEAGRNVKQRLGTRVAVRDLALMTRQLAVLLRAGMPLVEALSALIEQTSKPRLRAVVYDIRDRVNSGKSLGDALAMHPRIFSPLYTNMVRAGEAGGALEAILFRLAEILEHQAKVRSQLMSSLAYPMFMAVFAISVIVFLMVVIVPRITLIFQKQKAELPAITKALINTSHFIAHYWYFLVGAVVLVYMLWRMWVSREEGRLTWDRLKLRFPLYGTLHLKLVCARFARTLGTMLHSGLNMLPALDVVNSVLGNRYIQQQMEEVKAGVRRGRDLAVPLKETGLFPPMMIHMIELGQRSGELEDMLIRVAENYDDEVKQTVDAMVGLLEPVIIIIMGIFVGFLVLAILLPILTMSSNVGR